MEMDVFLAIVFWATGLGSLVVLFLTLKNSQSEYEWLQIGPAQRVGVGLVDVMDQGDNEGSRAYF